MRMNVRLAAISLFLTSGALAQSTYGTIYGSVTDPSSAVIRDAVVEAKNPATGLARTTKTAADGIFRFVNLDAGSYTITVTAPSFSSAERKGVVLTARDQVAVDFQLQLAGAAGTTVEVNAEQEVT